MYWLRIVIIWCSKDSNDDLLKVMPFLNVYVDYYYSDW